jgi:cobalt-zinc-cadmium efflux system outer membrane protein
MPLPVFNRNQGEIERARLEHEQLSLRIKALQTSIGTEVQTAYEQYRTSRAMLESIEKEMLQQARDVRSTTEYSYRRGEASLLEFLDAQRAFNDTIQSYNDARADYARSLYQLDSVSGEAVNR